VSLWNEFSLLICGEMHVRKIAKSDYELHHVCLSVRNNGYAEASQCYVVRTLTVLLRRRRAVGLHNRR